MLASISLRGAAAHRWQAFLSAQRVSLSLALTLVSLLLWAHSIATASFSIGFFGLIHSLPLTFFLSLGLLTIATVLLWTSPEAHEWLSFLQVSLLISALWLTPVLVGASLPFTITSYDQWRLFTRPILEDGSIDASAVWYHSWPASWILYATEAKVFGVDIFPRWIISAYPFLFQFVVLGPLYVLLRNTIGRDHVNYVWAAVWVFYLGNWVGQFTLSAQGPAYVLLLIVLALAARSVAVGTQARVADRLIIILALAALSVTHILTALVVLIILAVLSLAKRAGSPGLVVLGSVFVGAWLVYQAGAYLDYNLPVLAERVFRPDLLFRISVEERVGGPSASHEAVARIRVLTSALILATAVAGYLVSRWVRRPATDDGTMLTIGVASVLAGLISSTAYGWESPERLWLFLLPITAYFAVKLLATKATTLLLFGVLLLAVPLQVTSHTGNQALDYLPPALEASSRFVQEETSYGYITGRVLSWFIGPPEGYRSIPFEDLASDGGFSADQDVGSEVEDDLPHYINIGRYEAREYDFFLAMPTYIRELEASLAASSRYDLIYTNGEESVYLTAGAPALTANGADGAVSRR